MNTFPQIQPQYGESVVSARELHKALQIERPFMRWCRLMFEYGFKEDKDYTSLKMRHSERDYLFTLDTARVISMIQRTDVGKQLMEYFVAQQNTQNRPTNTAYYRKNAADLLKENLSFVELKNIITRQRNRLIIRLRPRKTSKKGNYVIYVRLNVNGVIPTDISTGIRLKNLYEWDRAAKKIRGHSTEVQEKNRALAKIKDDILTLYNDLIQKGIKVTAQILKDLYKSKPLEVPTIENHYQYFLECHAKKVRKSSLSTHQSIFKFLIKYLEESGQKKRIISEIDPRWAMNYHYYIVNQKGLQISYANRVVGILSQALNFAVSIGVLERNPLLYLKLPKGKKKPIKFLKESDLAALKNFIFSEELQPFVDVFLFSSFTGLAYTDLENFTPSKHIKEDMDGTKYIHIFRQKTDTECYIPLIDEAKRILEKYHWKKLPHLRHDEFNREIKKAATIANIPNPNEITVHVARKTAATLFLNRGIPLHTVSKILGHTSIKTTEKYYTALLNETIKTNFKNSGLL